MDGSMVSQENLVKSPLVISATKFVQTMTEAEFVDLISCLMRVVWAAAAGKLYLAAVSENIFLTHNYFPQECCSFKYF